MSADTARAERREHEAHDYRIGGRFYFVTWVWLLVLTAVELSALLAGLPRVILVPSLLVLAALKFLLGVANFMHVRFEKVQFIYFMLVAPIFVIILYIGVYPDFRGAL